jgi:uncharacterized SAM-binding protein YcdF (DUF218 family)
MVAFRLGIAVAVVATAAAVLFAGEFVLFAVSVGWTVAPADPRADAIVALTGGRDRVQGAIDLLEGGHGRRLLISGVNPTTRAGDIARVIDADRRMFGCCVDLGRAAESTVGNAREVADWARRRGFASLIVVTSAYHMPRSLLELKRTAPELTLVPYPVSRPDLHLDRWFLHPATTRLLFNEYLKYMGARLGLASLHAPIGRSTTTVVAAFVVVGPIRRRRGPGLLSRTTAP